MQRDDLAPWARWMPGWLLMVVLLVLATINIPIFAANGLKHGLIEWWITFMSETSILRVMLRNEKTPAPGASKRRAAEIEKGEG
jgi:hypothetical protein